MNQFNQTHQERFTSPEMKAAYGSLLNSAFDNYKNANTLADSLYKDYRAGKTIGDDSYFKQAWNQWQGLNTDNLNKLNLQSYNPNEMPDWVKANDDIEANEWRKYGKIKNQIDQNAIGSNMGGSTGHQSAAYNAAANYASQVAADRANRWQQQYNQNVANMMNANQQLNNIYQGRTGAGLQGWQTSQQGFSQMLNGIGLRDNALRSLGNAVEMGSDPTLTQQGRQWGTSTTDASQTTERSSGFGDIIGSAVGLFAPVKWFG